MIDLSYMQDRRIAVMGLGLGMVAAEALAASAVDVVAWDDTSERCKRPRREEFLSHHYWIRTGRASTA